MLTFLDYFFLLFFHAVFLFALFKRIKSLRNSYNEFKKTNNFKVMYFDLIILFLIILIFALILKFSIFNKFYSNLI
jgi:hypothetical protein